MRKRKIFDKSFWIKGFFSVVRLGDINTNQKINSTDNKQGLFIKIMVYLLFLIFSIELSLQHDKESH